ncbi:MAG: hypothetical protein AAF585_19070 [Verrucomicrobiota bacterium]
MGRIPVADLRFGDVAVVAPMVEGTVFILLGKAGAEHAEGHIYWALVHERATP